MRAMEKMNMTNQTQRPNIGIRSIIAILGRSLMLVWRLSAPLVLLLLVMRVVSAFIPAMQVLVVKELTDAVAGLLTRDGEMSEPVKWLAASGGLLLIGALLDAAAQYMTMLMKQKTQFKMETMLAGKSMSIPLSRFEEPQYYDQLQRAKMNVSFRGFQLIEQLFPLANRCSRSLHSSPCCGILALYCRWEWCLLSFRRLLYI